MPVIKCSYVHGDFLSIERSSLVEKRGYVTISECGEEASIAMTPQTLRHLAEYANAIADQIDNEE